MLPDEMLPDAVRQASPEQSNELEQHEPADPIALITTGHEKEVCRCDTCFIECTPCTDARLTCADASAQESHEF